MTRNFRVVEGEYFHARGFWFGGAGLVWGQQCRRIEQLSILAFSRCQF